jgi:hypothetical protein
MGGSGTGAWANWEVHGWCFVNSDQVVAMKTLGPPAKGRPALEWLPQICVF